jgi:hypothetical protein
MWMYTSTPPYALMVDWLVCLFLLLPLRSIRASVKRFVALQFINLRHSVGLLGRVISPSQGRYLTKVKKKVKISLLQAVGPLGLREVEASTLLRQTANRWQQSCQPYAPAALYRQVSFLRFLALISVRD